MSEDVIVSSLEITPAAHKALNKLNAFIRKGKPPKATVRAIHRFMDELVEALGIPAKSPCKAVCNACCKHAVEVSQIEAVVIANQYDLDVLSLTTNKHLFIKPSDELKYEGQLCPFNKEGLCQIYKHRPVVCRVFFSMEATPEPCSEKKSTQFNHRSSNVISDVFEYLSTGTNLKGSLDIRDFFGVSPIHIKELK